MKFVSIIGDRNFLYDGEPLRKNPSLNTGSHDIKSFSKLLWEDYEKEKNHFSEGIITRFLNQYDNKFEKYFFIATNQEGRVGKNDTIYTAKIIKKILEEREIHKNKIEIIEYNGNPSDENECLNFYKNNIAKYINEKDEIIFLNSGGTLQLKMSFIFWGLEFKNVNKFDIYSVNEGDGEIRKNYWPKIIYENSIKEEIARSLDTWNIKQAKDLSLDFHLINKNSESHHLFNFLEQRINNFDLKESLSELKKTNNYEFSKYFNYEIGDRKTLKDFWSLVNICYEKKQYLLIVTLFKSFIDIYSKLISIENNKEIPKYSSEKSNEFYKWKEEIWKIIETSNNKETEIYKFLNNKDRFAPYRNNSLLAHGVGSISKDEFDLIFHKSNKCKTFEEFMRVVDDCFKWKENYNIYSKIREKIKQNLK